MTCSLPTAADVRARLQRLPRGRVIDLSKSTGVPFPTLVKIRNGETANPGVETVRQFWSELISIQMDDGRHGARSASDDPNADVRDAA